MRSPREPLVRCPLCNRDFRLGEDDLSKTKCSHCGEWLSVDDCVREALQDRERYAEDFDRAELRTSDFVKVHPVQDWLTIGSTSYAVWGYPTEENVPVRNRDAEIIRNNDGKPEMVRQIVWHTMITNADGKSTQYNMNQKVDGRIINAIPCDTSNALHSFDGKLIKAEIGDVYRDVLSKIKAIVTFNRQGDAETVSIWVVAAHFFPVFSSFPHLLIGKPGFNSGGSTLLICAGCLLPRPVYLVDASEASIYRLVSTAKCSLLLDEFRADLDKRKKEAIILLHDSSFTKGAMIPRASGNNFSVELFEHYCPIAIVDPDNVITRGSSLSRDIRIALVHDPGKSIILNISEHVEKSRFLISALYSLFPAYAHRVYDAYKEVQEFAGRSLQTFAPLLAVARVIGVADAIMPTLKANAELTETIKNVSDPTRRILEEFCQYLIVILPPICKGMKPDSEWTQTVDGSFWTRLQVPREFVIKSVWEQYQRDVSMNDEGKTTERIWSRLPHDLVEQLKQNAFAQKLKIAIPSNVSKKSKSDNHLYLHFRDATELLSILRKIGLIIGIDYTDVHCDDGVDVPAKATEGDKAEGNEGLDTVSPAVPPRSTADPPSGSDCQCTSGSTDPLESDSIVEKVENQKYRSDPVTLTQKSGTMERQLSQQSENGDPLGGTAVDQDKAPTALTSIFEACRKHCEKHPGTDRFQLSVAISATGNARYDSVLTLLETWIQSGKITEDGAGLRFPEDRGV